MLLCIIPLGHGTQYTSGVGQQDESIHSGVAQRPAIRGKAGVCVSSLARHGNDDGMVWQGELSGGGHGRRGKQGGQPGCGRRQCSGIYVEEIVAAYMKLYGKESHDSDDESSGTEGSEGTEEEVGEEDGEEGDEKD